MKLKIKDTYILSLIKYPGAQQPTQVLLVAGILTPGIAERLKIREGCFNEEGVPRHYATFPSSTIRIDGADVVIGVKTFRSTLVHRFHVKQPKSGNEHDVSLEVTCRLHFDGKAPLSAVVDAINKDKFLLAVTAAQADLKFGDEEADGDDDEAEPDDDNQLSLVEDPAATGGATLASVATMGGRRKPKGQ